MLQPGRLQHVIRADLEALATADAKLQELLFGHTARRTNGSAAALGISRPAPAA